MAAANVNGRDAYIFGYLVEVGFEREARLRRAMPALRPARRLVGEYTDAFKLITRHVVGDGLQRAAVEGRSDAVAAIRPAVEERAKVHRRDRAVALHAGLHPHQDRVTPAVAIEDLFARQRDLDRKSVV